MRTHKLVADKRVSAPHPDPPATLVTGMFDPLPPCKATQQQPSASKEHVTIFYATDRAPVEDGGPGYGLGRDRSGLNLGTSDVSFLRDKRERQKKIPTVWTADPSDTDTYKPKVSPRESQDVFDTEIKQKLTETSSHRVLVFVHGFNVTFDEGAQTAAHLAYDFGFRELLILYSWPSVHSVPGYGADEDRVWWSARHLNQLLTELASIPGLDTIDLLAHNMGSRAVALALWDLSMDSAVRQKVHQVAFVAADIDSEIFAQLACGFISSSNSSRIRCMPRPRTRC